MCIVYKGVNQRKINEQIEEHNEIVFIDLFPLVDLSDLNETSRSSNCTLDISPF